MDMTNTDTSPLLERLLTWSLRRPLRMPARYGLATLCIIATGVFRALVISSIVPWLLFIPVILAIGLLLGRNPGIFASVVSAVVAALSIGHASEPYWLTVPQWTGSALFVIVTAGIAWFAAELRTVFARANRLAIEKNAAHLMMVENEEERNQLARIVENSADFIGMARLDGSVFFMNDAALRLVGLNRSRLDTVSIVDFFPPDEAQLVVTNVLPAVHRDGSWSGELRFRHFQTGELIPVLYTVFPVVDHDGTLVGYGTVTRDFRERKQAEEQQQLLNNELSHRLKNVLAVVQSIASQTLRQAADLPSAADALGARLTALGQATDVLTAQSWSAADLQLVVERALAPHGELGKRFRVSGPSITLVPQVTMAFALAMHELATNAAKYGALSTPHGHVDLTWNVTPVESGAGLCFKLCWQEVGGPEVHIPNRRGFGSMMIERSLKAYFRGKAQLEYPASGLVFRLEAPLEDAGQVNE